MQRNLRNEIMIAIGAILIVAFGLIFAILLSGQLDQGVDGTPVVQVSSPSNPATEQVSVTPSEESLPTETEEVTEILIEVATLLPTETAIPPSATDEETLEPTDTPSDEASLEASDEPSSTENETIHTDEASPTQRLIGRATRSATEEPAPSATNTRRPIVPAEASATNTRRPTATQEPSATNTRRSSATPEPSATNTRRPSQTPLPTATIRPSSTPTSQNAMLGIIPTPPPSPTVPPLNQASRTPSSCQLPQGWTSYTVQAGNTLFAISLATNSSIDELRAANCIENIDNIQAGDIIFVPRAPLRPVATLVPSGIRDGLRAIGCQNSNVIISNPISAQHLNGTFTVYGTAARSDFLYYKIEIRPDAASIYNFYLDSHNQVTNGSLGEINSELFGSGLHWLKLTVVDQSASIPADATCEIPVIFD
jgi:hypothetical protein